MKHFLVIIMLMFVFSNFVVAEEETFIKDKLTIDNLDVEIVIMDVNRYRFNEKYQTKLIFGDLPSTYFFNKNIPFKGNIYYDGKKVSYASKYSDYNIDTNADYLIDEYNEEVIKYKFGNPYDLFRETEDITIKYDLTFDSNKDLKLEDEFNYIVAQSEYDIKKVNFNIIIPVERTKSDVSFSLNGKDFDSKLKGISYEIRDRFVVDGTYNKTLKAGEKLTVKIKLKDDFIGAVSKKQIIVYVSIGAGFVCLLGIIISVVRKKRK